MRLAFDDAINVGEPRREWGRRSLVLRSPLDAAGRPAIEADLGERLAAFERGGQASERLPARHRHIDELRRLLQRVAGAAGFLGGDEGGATPRERLVDEAARLGVVGLSLIHISE